MGLHRSLHAVSSVDLLEHGPGEPLAIGGRFSPTLSKICPARHAQRDGRLLFGVLRLPSRGHFHPDTVATSPRLRQSKSHISVALALRRGASPRLRGEGRGEGGLRAGAAKIGPHVRSDSKASSANYCFNPRDRAAFLLPLPLAGEGRGGGFLQVCAVEMPPP